MSFLLSTFYVNTTIFLLQSIITRLHPTTPRSNHTTHSPLRCHHLLPHKQAGTDLQPVEMSAKDKYNTNQEVQHDPQPQLTDYYTTENYTQTTDVFETDNATQITELQTETIGEQMNLLVTDRYMEEVDETTDSNGYNIAIETVTSISYEVELFDNLEEITPDQEAEPTPEPSAEPEPETTSEIKTESFVATDEIGLKGIGSEVDILNNDLYFASSDLFDNNTFRYGKAQNIDTILSFNTEDPNNQNYISDIGGLQDVSLSENNYTFAYKFSPDIKPMFTSKEGEITEIAIHNKDNTYIFAVGNDHAIQHVIDEVNSGSRFDPYSVLKIDSQKHFGAHFYEIAEHTNDDHDHEHHEHLDEDQVTYSVTSSVSSKDPEDHSNLSNNHHEDSKHNHRVHPKDVYSVIVAVNYNDDQALAGDKTEMEMPFEDLDDSKKSSNHMSSGNVKVPGGIFTAFAAVAGLSIVLWII